MKVILIVMDTLRASHMSCYGYPRDTTPRLDELAGEGVLLERCLTQTAHTMPAFTTIVTGQRPFTHGIVGTLYAHPDEPDQVLGDTHPVLAEQFRNAGWLTAAFDKLLDFGCVPKWFARGYDFYVNTSPRGRHCSQVRGEDINARLLPWLRTSAREDFFLFVHYWDAHQAYNQPEPYRSLHSGGPRPARQVIDGRGYVPTWGWEDRLPQERMNYLDLYDGAISYGDSCIGAVVDALRELDAYDDAWIFFTADHGEDMEEHNAPFEHREPYEATCHVPLIVKPPADASLPRGSRIASMVGHIDLMPTILEVASLPSPPAMDGVSLLPLMRGDEQNAHEYLFLHGGACKEGGVWVCPELAVTDERWKLIRRRRVKISASQNQLDTTGLSAPANQNARREPMKRVGYFNTLPLLELYDLCADPYETTDVSSEHPAQVARLGEKLDCYILTNPLRWDGGAMNCPTS